MRLVLAALLSCLLAFFIFSNVGIAEDTASQAADEAAKELQAAIAEHSALSREAQLVQQQLDDLRVRRRVAQTRLRETVAVP